jgi:hypothetical protein
MGQNPLTAGGGVYGDLTTNEMDSVVFSNIYRVQDTALTNTARPIMRVMADINVQLGAGTYWLGFTFTGSASFSGPWTPPVALSNTANNLDAMQATANGVYNQAWQNDPTNTVPGAAMFEIEGAVVPEPGTFIAIGIGLAGLAIARRRK